MPNDFDPYGSNYDRILADSLGMGRNVDRFAAYKVEAIEYRMRGLPVRRVLDFGCGVGRSLPFLAATFPQAELWGFDPSSDCVLTARRRAPGAVVTDDWKEIPLGHFDCIMAANVFHHIGADARISALRRCASTLANKGSLFIFEHNPLNPLTWRVFERCPFDRGAKMIRREEMERVGALAGLRVQHAAYTLFLPFSGRITAALHRKLAWLPLGAQYYVQFVR
jgi:SAM-dependent methyltransferase